MKPYLKHFFLFLGANFGGLAIGAYLQGDIVTNVWYAKLKTASWTPPEWTFGLAWSQIMLFFSIYLVILVNREGLKQTIKLYLVCWLLNVSWNPLFFRFHYIGIALLVLVALLFCIGTFFIKYRRELRKKSMLLMPYIMWLLIAISLNAYVFLNN